MKHYAFLVILVLVIGCSQKNKAPVSTTPEIKTGQNIKSVSPPQPPDEDLIDENLPVMSTTDLNHPVNQMENKLYNLDLQSGDIKDVLLALIKETKIGLVIDPEISGNIPVMDLRSARLKDILNYLLPPLNLGYQWKDTNLHIFKLPLVTRYFNLNYISASRKGSRQVSFSTRSGGTTSGSMGGTGSTTAGSASGSSGSGSGNMGGIGGQNQSSSEITVNYQNSIWKTLIESLKVLTFGSLSQAASKSAGSGSGSMQDVVQPFAYSEPNGKKLIISPDTGVIVVTNYEQEIKKVARFINTFEGSAQRQVWIEAKIMEVNLYKGYQMGIDWGIILSHQGGYYGTLDSKRTLSNPSYSFTPGGIETQELQNANAGAFQFAISNNVIDLMLDAISKQGDLKVLASPRISTLNNEKAIIRVVREEVFFNLQTQISQGIGGNVSAPTINVSVVPIGIVMDIIPQINKNGEIILSINPDISELLEIRRFQVEGAMATQPVVDRRSIDTVAKLRNGQTLVIAGIIKERKNEILKGVPFLYKIPLIGNLFKRTEQKVEKTELVILITPLVHAGKTSDQLTESEIERIKNAVKPMRLGDVFPLKEGVKGEFKDFTKEKKKKQ